MTTAAAFAVALPFLGALAILALGHANVRAVRACAVLPTAAAFALVLGTAVAHGTGGVAESSTLLTPTGGIDITLGMRVDGLAAVIAVLVATVALLVQAYSTAYLRDDDRYASYAAFVSLFTGAMLLVVYSGDLVVLLVGWEVMGICSYLLIGHYWETEEARAAAVKAFVVTKLGDVPFLIGILVLGVGAGSFRVGAVVHAVPHGGATWVTAGTLLLLGGVAGKSAQAPLHVWLPDAMAGPTPVSALIHAATMVAAGAYVVARLYPVFLAAHATLVVLAVTAAVTMVGSALAALAQDDLKRVLAWSTVSQLAYMTGALAVGGRDAAMFLLLTHGAFKALLFLAAGVAIHQAGTGSLTRMGAADLRRRSPVVFWTMSLGLAALAGVPPLAGFFSKEAVLGAAERTALGDGSGGLPQTAGWLVLVCGLVTVALTAAYAARVWVRMFAAERGAAEPGPEQAAPHPERLSPWLTVPLLVLAVPTVLLGFTGLSTGWLPAWLGAPDGSAYHPGSSPTPGFYDLTPGLATSLVSLLLIAVGAGAVARQRRVAPAADPARALLGPLHAPARDGFGVDRLYGATVVRATWALASLTAFLDREVVDAYVRGSAATARLTGAGLRRSQNGNVRVYLTGLLAGVVILAVAVAVGS